MTRVKLESVTCVRRPILHQWWPSRRQKIFHGFKSENSPLQKSQPFEKDLLDIAKSVKFRNGKIKFQNQGKEDITATRLEKAVNLEAKEIAINS